MKILHVSSSPELDAGAEFCLTELINEELNDNIKPFVVVPKAGGLKSYLKKNNIPCYAVYSYAWRHSPKENKLRSFLIYTIKRILNYSSERKITSIIKQNDIDLVHINTTATNLGHLASKKTKRPLVWHIREFNNSKLENTFYSKASAKKIMGKSSAMIAVSNCIKTAYEDFISPEKLRVIYDKINFPSEQRVAQILDSNHLSICLVANITPQKGHIDALKALSVLPDDLKNITKLKLVGKVMNKDYFQELQEYIRENSLDNMISFEDFTTDIYKVLSNSDIALNCSWSESFGRTTIEAMLSGCLVIGSNNTCTHELLSDNHGFLYNNPEELASLIIEAYSNKDKARLIASNGQKFAHNSFNDGSTQIIDLFKETIRRNNTN